MKTVYVDIDTQVDFLFPAGALYVPGADALLPALARLNRFAARPGSSDCVISTMDAHSEDDPEFKDWPPHCVVGTPGQQKPSDLVLENPLMIPPDPVASLPAGPERQILLWKRELNLFSNPNLPRLLEHLQADRYVVYGVVTEYCVRFAALGLLDQGKPASLVRDAIQSLSDSDRDRTFAEFRAKGGVFTTVSEVLGQ